MSKRVGMAAIYFAIIPISLGGNPAMSSKSAVRDTLGYLGQRTEQQIHF